MVLDGLPDLYKLKYNSATAYRLSLYLCSYKLVNSAIGRFAPVATIPCSEETSSPAHNPEIAVASSQADAQELITPRVVTASFVIAFGTSVSHIHFDLSLST